MEGTRRITLVRPRTRQTDRRYRVWAVRRDRSGMRRLPSDLVLAGNWTTMFTVRSGASWADIDETWRIIDEGGVEHAIERVAEVECRPSTAGRRFNLLAMRHDPRSGAQA